MKKIKEVKVVEKRDEQSLVSHIYGLCNKKTDFRLQNEIFAKWYLRAFPEKLQQYILSGWFDDTYCCEWIDRFMRGTPSVNMDRQRLRAYLEVCIEWNNSGLKVVEETTFEYYCSNCGLIKDKPQNECPECHSVISKWIQKKNEDD